MSANPIANDARRARRSRRLPDDARCLVCHEANAVVLKTDGSTEILNILEAHHPVGRRIDAKLIAVICANCHLTQHELLRTAGIDLKEPSSNLLEQLASWLTAIGTFLHALADSATALAHRLRALLTALDHAHPSWRQLQENTT